MTEYKINFINNSYRRFYQQHKEELDQAWERCVSKGDLALRQEVWDLESTLASYTGTQYAIGLNSGTDALFLSLLALGIGAAGGGNETDEVITVSHTFIATLQAIHHARAVPVLVDVHPEDELINVDLIEQAITNHTRAIMPVHLTGKVCNMEAIERIAQKHGLVIIEDAAQALGAKYKGKMAGSFGAVGCFSFNNAKLMGCYGDGGAVATDSDELRERIALLRNHWNMYQLSVNKEDYPKPERIEWAWKSRLDNIQAAVLNVKFKYIDWILQRREEIAFMYDEGLDGLPCYKPTPQLGQVWQEYHLRVKEREQFVEFLAKRGIETLVRDEIPNHKQPGLGLDHYELPVTERLSREIVRIPSYPEMTNEEVNEVIRAIKNYYESIPNM